MGTAALLYIFSSAPDGYRRGGKRLVRGENAVDASTLTEDQLAQLHADPLLVVGEFAVDADIPSLTHSLALATTDQAAPGQGGGDPGALVPGALSGDVTGSMTLAQIFAELSPDNKEHFTGAGLPQLPILEQKAGRKVSAEERSAAWAEYKAQQHTQQQTGA